MKKVTTTRWTTLKFHEEQSRLWNSDKRFKVVPSGRRSGKTELAKRKLVIKALEGTDFPRPQFFAGAPTRDQAKRIYWEDLKAFIPQQLRKGKPKESELTIDLINGSSISVVGLDVPERVEGSPWDGGILDEYGNMKKKAWEENVRPALSDRKGWCWFIGVPEGRNHYFNLYKYAKSGEDKEWDAFHWFSSDILPREEIESAKNTLDELIYRQEYEGEFINFQGRIYYGFSSDTHIKRLNYYPDDTLVLCFDFNISPGICSIIQEQFQSYTVDGIVKKNLVTAVIGEIYIQRDSNTEKICREIIKEWGNHKGDVKCYGDSTGGSKGTAKVKGSDWDIVKETLAPVFGERLSFEIPQKNPLERQRINSVNSRLKSADGTIRLLVDPIMAPHVIDDFEGVESKENSSGEIDKNKNPELTHYTDAIGYYVHREFPYQSSIIKKSQIIGM